MSDFVLKKILEEVEMREDAADLYSDIYSGDLSYDNDPELCRVYRTQR